MGRLLATAQRSAKPDSPLCAPHDLFRRPCDRADAEFGTYEVTREEVLEFARKYDPQPFPPVGRGGGQDPFRPAAASGWHTAAMTMAVIARRVVEEEQAGPRFAGHRRAALEETGLSRRHAARQRPNPREDAIAQPPDIGSFRTQDDRHQSEWRRRHDLHFDRPDPRARLGVATPAFTAVVRRWSPGRW